MKVDDSLLRETLDTAAALGAVAAEAVVSSSAHLEIEVSGGAVETLAVSESRGLGLRLFTPEKRMGFAYSTHLAGGPRELVESAWQNAQCNDPDPYAVLLAESERSDDDWTEQDFSALPVQDKVDFARRLETLTLEADSRVSRVHRASYTDSRFEFAVANTNGLERSFRNAYCSCSVLAAAAQEGADDEMGWEFDFGRAFEALRPDWVARECAEDACRLLGARPCPTRPMPVVLAPRVTSQFIAVLCPALSAESVLKGKSMFAGCTGQSVASTATTLVDCNDLPEGINRAPFDGEGASAQRTVLIEDGVLHGYLHNAYTAAKTGERTTANARRGGFRSTPDVGPTNMFLRPGTCSRDDLFRMAGNGLYVTEAMGVHADPISGDFSFGVTGSLIEDGRCGRPVRGITIAGNIRELLTAMSAVADDLRFFGAFNAPSVLVNEIMVGGE